MPACTKCGAEISPDMPFCGTCGAPLAAAAASTPPPPVSPSGYEPVVPPTTGYTPPPVTPLGVPVPPAPPQKSGGVLKIVLIVIGVIALLGVLALGTLGFLAWRVMHSIKTASEGGTTSMRLPGGNITTNGSKSYSAEELGTEIYPGSTSVRGGMKMDLPTGSMVTGVFTTTDSKEQVVAFYKARLGAQASVMESGETAVMTERKSAQETVMVTVTQKGDADNGKTKIAIVHTTSKQGS